MSDKPADSSGAISADALKRAEEFIEQEEGASSHYRGWLGYLGTGLAVAMSLYHLYAAWDVVPTYLLRQMHVGFVLVLVFLLFPVALRFRNRFAPWDFVLIGASIAVIYYLIAGGDDLTDRATTPTGTDVTMGVIFVLLVLEATRRTTGWIMPVVAICFVLYALFGPYLPSPWTHKGYEVDRLIGQLYMTLEGIFGTAVDVSSSLIVLFTIFGAVLQFSGAGKFFIDFSFSAMGGKPTSAGRAIVLSSFLLGGPSGSGVATTVTLGSVAYPMLKKSGYGAAEAGGLLAAGGLGAIISPPVLGAAAFLIAEFLKISYLDVIWMATIPTILYYFALFVMVELDAGKFGISTVTLAKRESLWAMTKVYGYHFTSLISIIVFMLLGYTPVLAVFYSTLLAIAVSFVRRDTALYPKRLIAALESGSIGVLGVAATCATAGIIVGVVGLTGLGFKFSDIVISYARGSLLLTAIFTSLVVWIVGLAVPVTASYIICAVIAAPALIKLGVPDYAAHMFIFYYAVLSEVSPPTALSPFAAAAITGADPYATTLQSWKYTLPAFLVPFVFVMDPLGVGLLLNIPKGGGIGDIVYISITTAIGIFALASAAQAWLIARTTLIERGLLLLGGLLMVFSTLMEAIYELLTPWHLHYTDALGIVAIVAALTLQLMRRRKVQPATRA
jgi:TRAP transporter 4TM/12TM fusion protein